jgi:peptidoglycan/LPS O-acetylase OafA/YrhL
MGWMGVDLFFVLSGYLVSSLLFKEWRQTGAVSPLLFLVRRGFKIYPLYYAIYLIQLGLLKLQGRLLDPEATLSELFFLQNYVFGFGQIVPQTWSLAVEEHFYLLLACSLWLATRYRFVSFEAKPVQYKPDRFQLLILLLMCFCLILRAYTSNPYPFWYTMTHLRLDALLAGVFVSYSLSFENSAVKSVFKKHRLLFGILGAALICWSPFVLLPGSYFIQTVGLTLSYLSASIALLYCLVTPEIEQKMNRICSKPVVYFVSLVGEASYAIYLFHWLVNTLFALYCFNLKPDRYGPITRFLITSTVTVSLGLFLTFTFEAYFLKLRNRLYPSNSKA